MFSLLNPQQKEPKFLVTFGSFKTKSDLPKLYAKTARYYYFLLLKRFALIMDELHWLNDYYINITDEFNDEFSKIAMALETIEERNDEIVRIERKVKTDKVAGLVGATFRPFFTLYQDQNELRSNWKNIRDDVYSTLRSMTQDYAKFNHQLHEYPIPGDMEETFSNLDQLLSEFKVDLQQYKVVMKSYSWDELSGVLDVRGKTIKFKPETNRHMIFSRLISNLGKFVSLEELSDDLGYSKAQIRTEINQIKRRIANKGLAEKVQIHTAKKGAYKLTIL